MGLFKKKEVIEKEPQYYMSATNVQILNYKVYYMSIVEKILYFLIAFVLGAAVGYLFYGGIGKNEYGMATTTTKVLNVLIPTTVGLIAGKLFLPIRVEQIMAKRHKNLSNQFRDMLEGLTTSLGAGNNTTDSFVAVYNDMKIQYEEDAYIIKELAIIVSGIHNNILIEDLIYDFGMRSGNGDILSFADVFKISYRKGGNIKDIIRNTHNILSEKMEIGADIETIVTSMKTEQNLMIVMPIALIGVIKMMSPEMSANYATATGIMSTTIAIVFFVGAYFIGRIVLNIKI